MDIFRDSKDPLLNKDTLPLKVEESGDISESVPITASGEASVNTEARPTKDRHIPLRNEELREKLYECFKALRYWHIKDLQEVLEQPFGHLLLGLEEIATQVTRASTTTGRQVKLWCLKREHQHLLNLANAEDDTKAEIETDVMEEPGLDH